MSRRRREKKTKQKNQGQQVQAEERFAFDRRRFLRILALGGAYAAAEATGIGPVSLYLQSSRTKDVQLPNQWNYLRQLIPNEDLALFGGFLRLPQEQQKEALSAIEQRVLDETRIGLLYNHIIERSEAQFITFEGLRELSATQPIAAKILRQTEGDMQAVDGHGHFAGIYSANLDRVIVFPAVPASDLARLLALRETRACTLAHEAIHKIQHNEWPDARCWRFIMNSGENTVDDLFALNERTLRTYAIEVLQRPDATLEEISNDFILRIGRMGSAYGEQMQIFEVGARFVEPKEVRSDGAINFGTDLFSQPYNITPQDLSRLVRIIMPIYGFYAQNDSDIDVDLSVARCIGQYGASIDKLQSHAQELIGANWETYRQRGSKFIGSRWNQLAPAPAIAKEILREYVR